MDLKGTIGDTLSIGRRGVLDATGLSAERVIALPDRDGMLLSADGGTLTNYRETAFALGSRGTSPVVISFLHGNIQTVTCTGSGPQTWVLTDAPPAGTAGSMTIIATNPGRRDITVNSGVWLPAAPMLPAAGVALINAITVDGGGTYYLTAVGAG